MTKSPEWPHPAPQASNEDSREETAGAEWTERGGALVHLSYSRDPLPARSWKFHVEEARTQSDDPQVSERRAGQEDGELAELDARAQRITREPAEAPR